MYKLAKADDKRVLGNTTMASDYLEALTSSEKKNAMLAKRMAAIDSLLCYKGAEDELKAELEMQDGDGE